MLPLIPAQTGDFARTFDKTYLNDNAWLRVVAKIFALEETYCAPPTRIFALVTTACCAQFNSLSGVALLIG